MLYKKYRINIVQSSPNHFLVHPEQVKSYICIKYVFLSIILSFENSLSKELSEMLDQSLVRFEES